MKEIRMQPSDTNCESQLYAINFFFQVSLFVLIALKINNTNDKSFNNHDY